MDDKDRLRAEVVQLMTRFADSRDAHVILGPEAGRVAAELLALAQSTVAGVPAFDIVDSFVLAYFYWYRSQVGPQAQAAEDLELAKAFFRGLLVTATERVPEEVRDELLDDPARQSNLAAMTLAQRASDCYRRARADRDLIALDEAIALTKRIVALDLSDQVVIEFHATLSNLRRDRYEWAGDLDDLDASIAAARAATATGVSTGTDH